jgi:type I restriction enzyme S subunit
VAEAQSLRREASEEAGKLIGSALARVFELSNAPKVSLREIYHFQRGRFSWRPRNDPRFYDGEYPFIQIGDIPRTGKYITSHTQTLNNDGLAVSRLFSIGTIVISIAATIGAVGILSFDSCMPDSLVGLKPLIQLKHFQTMFITS